MLKKLEDFETQITQTGPTVLKFWGASCGPCKLLAPVMERIADTNPQVAIYEFEVNRNFDLPAKFHVTAIPAVLFFKDGKEVSRIVGLHQQKDYQSNLEELTKVEV